MRRPPVRLPRPLRLPLRDPDFAIRTGEYRIEWVYVVIDHEYDQNSPAEDRIANHRWTEGKPYKVRGMKERETHWKVEVYFYLRDDEKRLVWVHEKHVRDLEED